MIIRGASVEKILIMQICPTLPIAISSRGANLLI